MPSRRRSRGISDLAETPHAQVGDLHVALGGPLVRRDEREHARLARAGMPGEKDELSLRDVEREIAEGRRPVGPDLGDVTEPDHAGAQRLVQIGDEVVGVLDAAGEPHEPVGEAECRALLRGQVAVRGLAWLGDQALHAREAGGMEHELEPLEEALGAGGTAGQGDAHHPAESVERARRDLVVGMGGKPGVVHAGDALPALGPAGHGHAVVVVARHAHRQGLHAAGEEPRLVGIDRRAPRAASAGSLPRPRRPCPRRRPR